MKTSPHYDPGKELELNINLFDTDALNLHDIPFFTLRFVKFDHFNFMPCFE